MSYLTNTTREDRVIALIDMDCFYAQVEQRERPELWGTPVAVAQYNQWKGGSLIAVSYEARAAGVKRGSMRGDEAKAICPELTICYVPISPHVEKADLTKYRNASAEVFKILNDFDSRIIVERASIDEAYLDLTALIDQMSDRNAEPTVLSLDRFPTTHVADGKDKDSTYIREDALKAWLDHECSQDMASMRFALGAVVVEQIRARIKDATKFHCSAGVGANKILAKLVCARHKPKQQTIIPNDFVNILFETTPLRSVRSLGGKLGKQLIEGFNIQTMGDLAALPKDSLLQKLGPKVTSWLQLLAKGIDHEEVKARDIQLSIGVSKNFPGPSALTTVLDVTTKLQQLVNELSDRLSADRIKNKRTARSLSVGCTMSVGPSVPIWTSPSVSRHCSISSCAADVLYRDAWQLLRQLNQSHADGTWEPPMLNLCLLAGKFTEGVEGASKSIKEFMTTREGTSKHIDGETDDSIDRDDDDDSDRSPVRCNRSPLKRQPDDQQSEVTDVRPALVSESVEEEERCTVELIEDVDEVQAVAVPNSSSSTMPASFADISTDVLNDLPSEIRMELSHFYRQLERPSASTAPKSRSQPKSKSAAKSGKKKAVVAKTKAVVAKAKAAGTKKPAAEHPSTAMYKISDYFNRKS